MKNKLACTIWCLILLTPIGFAQEPQSITTREISIDDVTQLALDNSLDIQIAQYDAYIKRVSLMKAESIFDAFFNASVGYTDDRLKQSSTIFGNKNIGHNYSFGVSKKLPTGTELSLNFSDGRAKTNSSFTTLNPYHEARVGISLVQPLGKNFFGLADRASIKLTKKDIESAEYTSLDDIERSLYNVQVAYWKYVLRCEELEITEDIYGEALWLYELYQEKLKTGLIEKGDLYAAEANLKLRERDVLLAKLAKETAKNDLLFLLNVYDFDVELIPSDRLMTQTHTVDLDKEMKLAVKSRRDYKRIKSSLEANKIDIVDKKNALWPEIDLEASFTRNGLNRKYQEAWREISTQDNREVFVGISLTIPFENRAAKADLKEANLQKEQLLLQLKQSERLILKDIHNAVTTVNVFKEQVANTQKIASLQEAKLDEEIKRLKYGRSNADTIIRYTEDVLKAQIVFASALYKYRVSLIDVDLAANTLLDKYWQEPL